MKKNNSFVNSTLFGMAFFIPFFDSGFLSYFFGYWGALSSIFAVLLIFGVIGRNKKNNFFYIYIFSMVGLIVSSFVIGGLYNELLISNFGKRVFHLWYVTICSYSVFLAMDNNEKSFDIVERAVILSVRVCVCFSVFQYFVFTVPLLPIVVYLPFDYLFHFNRDYGIYDVSKIRSVSAEANYLGMYLSFALPIVLFKKTFSKANFLDVFFILLIAFLSGSRYIFIALFLVFFLGSNRYIFLTLSSVLIGVWLVFYKEIYALILLDNSMSIRIGITLSELDIFLANPFFGTSLGGISNAISGHSSLLATSSSDWLVFIAGAEKTLMTSFNFVTQFFAEIGVFSLIPLAYIIYPLFVIRKRKSKLEKQVFWSYLATIVAMCNFATINFYAFPLMIGASYAVLSIIKNKYYQ